MDVKSSRKKLEEACFNAPFFHSQKYIVRLFGICREEFLPFSQVMTSKKYFKKYLIKNTERFIKIKKA
jgi:hypothetical protein